MVVVTGFGAPLWKEALWRHAGYFEMRMVLSSWRTLSPSRQLPSSASKYILHTFRHGTESFFDILASIGITPLMHSLELTHGGYRSMSCFELYWLMIALIQGACKQS